MLQYAHAATSWRINMQRTDLMKVFSACNSVVKLHSRVLTFIFILAYVNMILRTFYKFNDRHNEKHTYRARYFTLFENRNYRDKWENNAFITKDSTSAKLFLPIMRPPRHDSALSDINTTRNVNSKYR